MKKKTVKPSLKKTLSNVAWVYKQFYSINKLDTVLITLLPFLMAFFPIINSYLWAKVIDGLINLTKLNVNTFEQFLKETDIAYVLIFYSVISLISSLFYRIDSYVYRRFYDIHLDIFRMNLTKKLANLDVASTENQKIYKLTLKGRDNLYKINSYIDNFSDIFINIIQLITNSVIIIAFSPFLYIVYFILMIPESLIQRSYTQKKWDFYNTNAELNGKIYWIEGSLQSIYNRSEHVINSATNFLYRMYKSMRLDYIKREFKIEKWIHNKRILLDISTLFKDMFSIYYFINKLLQKAITIGDLTFLSSRIGQFSGNLTHISSSIIKLTDANIEIDTLRDIFALEPIVKSGDQPLIQNEPPKIEFKNVWFKYPDSEKYVLKDINLTINHLDEIAFVGENGVGKTTLIKLLLRTYDPTKGEILLNGVNIKEFMLEQYLSLFGVLLQRFNAYSELDVKTNIAISRPNDRLDMEKVIEASKKADAYDFIQKLDNKFNQILAKQLENGTELSGGQWQKIAFARLFYRNAPIMIMDEATSAIDAEAEERIFTKLYETVNDKIVILISHRFATVRHAKRIFVIEDGKISEQGSHKQLLDLEGKYARMFKSQAKGYVNE